MLRWLVGLLLIALPQPVSVAVAKSVAKDELPRVYLGHATDCHDEPNTGRTWLEVTQVVPGSPSERAGLATGDQIVAFNGVSFRFKTDGHKMRSLSWIEPNVPLQLSVIRAGTPLELTLLPEPISQDQLQRFKAWLEDFEARGDRSCSATEDPLIVEWRALQDRVIEAGGKATIVVERLPGDPPSFKVSSQQIVLPEGFDWRAHWPSYDILAQRIKPDQTFVISIEVSETKTVVDVFSDYVAYRKM